MPRFDSDGDEIFFDALDDIRTSMEASSSDDCTTSDKGSAPRQFEYKLWVGEPTSVQERRQRFLRSMGFDEFIATGVAFPQCQGEIITKTSLSDLEERIITSGSSSDSHFSKNESALDRAYCIRDLDSGKRFVVHDGEHNGLTSMLKEVGSDKVMSLPEFESLLGFSQSVKNFMQREHDNGPIGKKNGTFGAKKKDIKSLWRCFTKKMSVAGICKNDVHLKKCTTGMPFRTRVQHQKKKFAEFSAVYMCQEIQAHEGSIRVMKFSPSGWYLASGGEDCVVRIWQIREVESSPKLYGGVAHHESVDENEFLEPNLVQRQNYASSVMPKKAFNILETPLHEFLGHTSDILDMTWSKSDCLLTSSKDNTVRMWKVGCDGCLAVFKHRAYVTCVQFNPIDERYFISGSIDGKVRIWDVLEKRVIDWTDTRDIITALSYQPDGKGFIVGTTAGACRFYDLSGDNMQLEKHMHIQRKKKSAVCRINSLQFSQGDSHSPRIIITSTDSKIRVVEGVDIIKKFEGPWKSKALSSPSLISDGRYLISAGKDSNVYIWNFDTSTSALHKGGAKSVHSCELFFSKDLTTAVPWPGGHQGRHVKPSCLTQNIVNTPISRHNGKCCSLGTWILPDALRESATWPEEKLPSLKPAKCPQLDYISTTSTAWNMVIVTASSTGVIRSFHNYGLPVRI